MRSMNDVDIPRNHGLSLEVVLNAILATLAAKARVLDAPKPGDTNWEELVDGIS